MSYTITITEYNPAVTVEEQTSAVYVSQQSDVVTVSYNAVDVQGIQGLQGPQGEQGPQGPIGLTGEQGIQGPIGLTGEQGPIGLTGEQGPIGLTGDSAYAVAVTQGFLGTEEEWLATLVGPQGIQGLTGADGTSVVLKGSVDTVGDLPVGADLGDLYVVLADGDGYVWNGATWDNVGQIQGPVGPTGDTGDTGSSAYEIAVANGFIGTETQWLATLVGPQGATGPQGVQGLQGIQGLQGVQGIQGETGEQGPIGLTGEQGPTGETGPGLAAGGTTGQVAAKASDTDYDTTWTTIATVATTGSYTDLLNQPTIPADTGDLTNGAGFATTTYVDTQDGTTLTSANSYTDTAVTGLAATAYVDTQDSATLTSANSYTDTAVTGLATTTYVDTQDSATLTSANSYTDTAVTGLATTTYVDTQDSATLASANSYTDTAVANVIDSAPELLDTLNELAAALGDDPNFATTVTNNLATKASITYVDTQDGVTLSSANSYTDTAISAIDFPVDSVNGQTQTVVLDTDDIGEGTTNLYYTDTRARNSISLVTDNAGSLSYNNVTGVLTYNDPTGGGPIGAASRVVITVRNETGSTIPANSAVYIIGHSGNNTLIGLADANNPGHYPAVGIMLSSLANNTTGEMVSFGEVTGFNTTGYAASDVLYLSETPGQLTNVRPIAESTAVQNIARVIRQNESNGTIIVMGAGRANDVPNLTNKHVFIGTPSNGYEKRTLTTDDIDEGTNLFYTDARAQAVSINEVVEDLTPQLGGDLDVNGAWINNDITTPGDLGTLLRFKTANGTPGEWPDSGIYKNRRGYLEAVDLTQPASTLAFSTGEFVYRFGTTHSAFQAQTVARAACPVLSLLKGSVATFANIPDTGANYLSATSTTGMSIAFGFRNVTVGTGKNYVANMGMRIVRTSNPNQWMVGYITYYNSFSGVCGFIPVYTQGGGFYSDWTVDPAQHYWVEDEEKFYIFESGAGYVEPTLTPNDSAIAVDHEAFRFVNSIEGNAGQQTRLGSADGVGTALFQTDVSAGAGGGWGAMSETSWGREPIKGMRNQMTITGYGELGNLTGYATNVEFRPTSATSTDSLTVYSTTAQSSRVGFVSEATGLAVSTTVNNASVMRPQTFCTLGTVTTNNAAGTYSVSVGGRNIVNTIENFYGIYWSNASVVAQNKYVVYCDDNTVKMRVDGEVTIGTIASYSEKITAIGNTSGTVALDAMTAPVHTLTATGAITLNAVDTTMTAGQSITVIITQDGTGGQTLTSDWKFAGASKTLSTDPNAIDVITVFYDGTNYLASLVKGYA